VTGRRDQTARIVEADETFVLMSRKGERKLQPEGSPKGGKASKRGLSDEQVQSSWPPTAPAATVSAVLPAVSAVHLQAVLGRSSTMTPFWSTDGLHQLSALRRPRWALAMKRSTKRLESASEANCIFKQFNSRHERLKTFLRRHRGVATKYLDSYLRWFPSRRAAATANPARGPRRKPQESCRFGGVHSKCELSHFNAVQAPAWIVFSQGIIAMRLPRSERRVWCRVGLC